MYENEILDFDNNSGGGIELSPRSIEFLAETAKWARFIAIIGFIFLGLMVLVFLVMGGIGLGSGNSNMVAMMGGGVIAILYLLFIVGLYFYPIYSLYQFGTKTRQAIQANDTKTLEEGLSFLKGHYKYVGVLIIVVLSLYVLIFLGAIVFTGLS